MEDNAMNESTMRRVKPIKRGMKTLTERSLIMDLGSFYIPKKSKSNPRGEDAHFISKHHQTFGLADGVAGWAKKGIDAGKYARELMDNCLNALYTIGEEIVYPHGLANDVVGWTKKSIDEEIVYPQAVLEEAYFDTEAKGSSTACIITLTDEYLNVVNVGDTGFMLFRNGNVIYKSYTHQHDFNCPYQLGKRSQCDDPSIAEELIIGVKAGDVVVAGTHGLFYNMFASEMEVVIKVVHEEGCLEPQVLARVLAEVALENSMDKDGDSPYTRAALMEGYLRSGGIPDDITVVVAHIVPPMAIHFQKSPIIFNHLGKKIMEDNVMEESRMRRIEPTKRGMKTLTERSLMMDLGSFYIPKKSKSNPRGEDAHFICKHHQTIGLADGVTDWAKKGIDAGEYARQLMDNCLTALYAEDNETVYPQTILEKAYFNTEAQGSSTACIITLTDEYLNVVNVGDSGFMLFRNGKMIYKSSTQQHYFNCPCQLGKSTQCDDPSAAEELIIGVKAGDVVVAGTDGLFDNMFASEMEVVIRVVHEEGCSEPQVLARVLAEVALDNSLDKDGDSPYTRAALMEGELRSGGKPDDITVVVAHIVPPKDIL